MADMDFSQAFTYSDINDVYLMAVELSGGLVSQHGSVQLERIFQDSTLYAQVSALKNEMESILQNFTGASEYDDTATYAVGDYCTKDDYLYQCNTAVSAESWDASKWDVVTISSQYTMLKNILGVDDYSTSASYAVGDLVVYDGKMYRCTTAVSGGAWDASKWSETSFVAEVESAIAEIQNEGATQIANVQAVYADDMAEVNAKVSRNTKEIANLIQKEGVVSVSYPDSIYGRGEVPSGMAKFAEVNTLRGVTRVANNLVNPADSSTSIVNGITFTNNGDGSWTVSGATGDSSALKQIVPYNMLANHSYLLAGARGSVNLVYSGQGTDRRDTGSGIIATITTDNYKATFIYVPANVTLSSPITIRPISTDLTSYFSSDPSVDVSALTIADIQQNYPELLVPSAYDAGSLVSTTYESVVSRSNNLLDIETWANDRGCSFTKNGNEYTFGPQNSQMFSELLALSATDVQMTISGSISAGTAANPRIDLIASDGTIVTTIFYNTSMPVTATFKAIRLNWSTIGTIKLSSFKIELGTSATSYSPYGTLDTLTLPSPVTLRSAGSVADTDELNVEVDGVERRRKTQRIGSVDLGTLNWTYSTGSKKFYATLNGQKNIASSDVGNILCSSYLRASAYNLNDNPYNMCCASINGNEVQVKNLSKTSADLVSGHASWLEGVMFYHELADPIITLTDPILDNFVMTEAGGTITPKQTQTHKIDTSFDIGYLAL